MSFYNYIIRLFEMLLLVIVILSAVSCDEVLRTGNESKEVAIYTFDSQLFLINNLEKIVYYVALEAETATVVDLNPNFKEWPRIEPGTAVIIPYDKLMGYDKSSDEAWVTWRTGDWEHHDSIKIDL